MKGNRKYWQGALLMIGMIVGLAIMATQPVSADGHHGTPVIPPTSKKVRQTYQELAAARWNWALQFPAATNPVEDPTGESCHLGQQGPVWFLAGTFGGTVTRTCTIPEGKFLFFPIVNVPGDVPRGYSLACCSNASRVGSR
jgi:hypothetical protein